MKIFVGYASQDINAAREVVSFLESLGQEVWFDKRSLIGGDEWDAERKAAQEDADLIVHLCSQQILTRKGVVNREIRETLRLAEDRPFGSNLVVFIRLDDIQLPAEFRRYQYIDFKGTWQASLAAVVGKKAGQAINVQSVGAATLNENISVSDKTSVVKIEEQGAMFELAAEYIQYNEPGIYWRMVNSAIEADALEGLFSFKADMASGEIEDMAPEDKERLTSTSDSSSTEFFRSGELVSILVYTYSYWGGAAHPNHSVQTMNFAGSDKGRVRIQDLLQNDDDKARKLLAHCLKVIEVQLGDEPIGYWLVDQSDSGSVWEALTNFSFDKRGITVHFSPYVVLPYAAGIQEVQIPWSVMSGYLGEKYENLYLALQ
ncbi:TIR domain-containing protein [Rhizobium leguminosarum]|uniref:TIR domain-containing protein n=1 Tax=Rhizobium leguminosarum TaxID=384 RepID=UPI001A91C74C|nr:TIR domain-containing protein [Rhizobium leguminosarum]MBY5554130.1 TIR domain-containing protein [Rhizobium leguminosarum]MBY5723556.1 TIR domain-containing protein [Rhizobium leguminosarum]QSW27249.1 TIR domain-containing protein [Rhizobium leguminosarum]